MEGFAWEIIHFGKSTVPFNSHVFALQLLLVCVAQKFCHVLLQLMEQELVCSSAVKLYQYLCDLADRVL